jgi:hypothetical protein
MSTISSSITVGIVLGTVTSGGTYDSPLTITSTGAVLLGGTGDAIFGPNTDAWTVVNQGSVVVSGTAGDGIDLRLGGSVDNSGLIDAPIGVYITGAAGTLSNSGTINSTGTGTAAAGIVFQAGGSVDNAATGLIEGANVGIYIGGATGSVTNFGTIHNQVTSRAAVDLGAGGSVTNGSGSSNAFAYIKDVRIAGTAGTVVNYGTIAGTATGIELANGGMIINGFGAVINSLTNLGGIYVFTAAGTVSNSGSIGGLFTGVSLQMGGIITNEATGLITATAQGTAVGIFGADGTVTNLGSIGSINSSGGVFLDAGGTITNGSTLSANAVITASTYSIGVYLGNAGGTLNNYGNIASGRAVVLLNGGSVVNQLTGSIVSGNFGTAGVAVSAGTAIITNFGTIAGRNGVAIAGSAGAVINSGTAATIAGTGTAGVGIILQAGGTVVNSGTISGAGGIAISFGGSGDNRLVLERGYQLGGSVQGSATAGATNTLELSDAAGAVTVDYNGLGLTNFSEVLFGPGGNETLVVGNASGTLGVTIAGFDQTSEVIDLTGIGSNGTITSSDTVTDRLTVTGSLGSLTLQFDSIDGLSFTTGPDGGGTDLSIVCFCRGTLILTERGELPVEALAVGDRVQTLSGASKPIRWIGFGRDLVTEKNPLARPIIVRRGALADDIPRRDLYLTHGHALYFDGVLIPVEHLVNHRSILWDDTARVVEYYHLELDEHEVVFAEGAPAETYYDAGNRALFHNTRPGAMAGTARASFAPVLNGGEIVGRIWAGLHARAGGQLECETTDDPDLHLVVDGERLDPASRGDCTHTFVLARPPAGPLLLRSRSFVPSLTGTSRHDHRRLGVAIRQIILHGPGMMTCLEHDAPLFREGGCHAAESGYCWTDGELLLPAGLFAHAGGKLTLIVHTRRQAMRYPVRAVAAAA